MSKLQTIKKNLQGFIKKPRIVVLPDGPDHLNWLEVGKKSKKGWECTQVSWAQNFGHLWATGWIDDENIKKARQGKPYKWLSSGIGGHGCP